MVPFIIFARRGSSLDHLAFTKFGAIVVDGWRMIHKELSLSLLSFDMLELGNRRGLDWIEESR